MDAAGVRFPRDIAPVGFDDMMPALALRSQITAVSQPTYEIGRQATELLLRRVNGELFAEQHITLPAKLKIRESSVRRG
ncbi:MAG: substrate-binding domain-containing protein [Actinoallomurus sp.]